MEDKEDSMFMFGAILFLINTIILFSYFDNAGWFGVLLQIIWFINILYFDKVGKK